MTTHATIEPPDLEANIARLLALAEVQIRMPPATQVRIRSGLVAMATQPPASTDRPSARPFWAGRRLRVLIAATAAATVLVLITLWPGGSPPGVSWAEVAEHLISNRAVAVAIDATTTTPTGEQVTHLSQAFFKDPGLSRIETSTVPPAPPGRFPAVVISQRSEAGAEQLILDPGLRHALRISHVFEGRSEGQRPVMNMVEESWHRLSAIAGETAARIADRKIDGGDAIGFEVPLEALMEGREMVESGSVRVWAAAATAVPVLIELDLVQEDGTRHHTTIHDIEWDGAVDESLFDLTPPPGWSVTRTRRTVVSFQSATLAGHVSLHIGPEQGPALVSAADVLRVTEVEYFAEEHPGGAPATIRMSVEISAVAARRLADYEVEHATDILLLDFNRETRTALPSTDAGRTTVTIDLSRLDRDLPSLIASYIQGS